MVYQLKAQRLSHDYSRKVKSYFAVVHCIIMMPSLAPTMIIWLIILSSKTFSVLVRFFILLYRTIYAYFIWFDALVNFFNGSSIYFMHIFNIYAYINKQIFTFFSYILYCYISDFIILILVWWLRSLLDIVLITKQPSNLIILQLLYMLTKVVRAT